MAEITCCSGANCDSLLTLGYMQSLMQNCKSLKKGGSAYNGCCNAPSSSTVVSYSDATGKTYADLRTIDNTNPNNDKSGFIYNVSSRTKTNSCCQPSSTGNTILKRSEATYAYTTASNNTLNVTTRPTSCSLGYSVTETRSYVRHSVTCNGNSISDSTSAVTATNGHTGFITKSYSVNSSNNLWDITFSTATVNGQTTDDCGGSKTSSTSLTVAGYSVGYTLDNKWDGNLCGKKVPCEGLSGITFTYSANTSCENDFKLSFTGTSGNQPLSTDSTITTANTVVTSTTVGGASIEVRKITINIGMNSNGIPNGSFTITAKVNGTDYVYTCNYEREMCAWTGKATNPTNCAGHFSTVCWNNEPDSYQYGCETC